MQVVLITPAVAAYKEENFWVPERSKTWTVQESY